MKYGMSLFLCLLGCTTSATFNVGDCIADKTEIESVKRANDRVVEKWEKPASLSKYEILRIEEIGKEHYRTVVKVSDFSYNTGVTRTVSFGTVEKWYMKVDCSRQ